MYCPNCGNTIGPNENPCPKCGAAKGAGKNYCASCGKRAPKDAKTCPACGATLAGRGVIPPSKLRLAPLLASASSFFIWGMAQVLNGQKAKGIILFLIYVAVLSVNPRISPARVIGGLASALDAFFCARRMAKGEAIGYWRFF